MNRLIAYTVKMWNNLAIACMYNTGFNVLCICKETTNFPSHDYFSSHTIGLYKSIIIVVDISAQKHLCANLAMLS